MTAEMVRALFARDFWTDIQEMLEDINEQGFEVIDYNEEYVAVADENEKEFILYLGHANSTIWIESVREY